MWFNVNCMEKNQLKFRSHFLYTTISRWTRRHRNHIAACNMCVNNTRRSASAQLFGENKSKMQISYISLLQLDGTETECSVCCYAFLFLSPLQIRCSSETKLDKRQWSLKLLCARFYLNSVSLVVSVRDFESEQIEIQAYRSKWEHVSNVHIWMTFNLWHALYRSQIQMPNQNWLQSVRIRFARFAKKERRPQFARHMHARL